MILAATGVLLLAQPAPAPAPPADESKETTPEVKLTVPEMTEQIVVFQTQVNEDTRIVMELQRKARKQQDVIKLNCINDALMQIKALRNIMDRSKLAFEGTVVETENREYYKSIADSSNNIRQLRERANICAGEGELVSDSRNTFDGPDIPDDPSDDLFPEGDYIEPPGYASPYK